MCVYARVLIKGRCGYECINVCECVRDSLRGKVFQSLVERRGREDRREKFLVAVLRQRGRVGEPVFVCV